MKASSDLNPNASLILQAFFENLDRQISFKRSYAFVSSDFKCIHEHIVNLFDLSIYTAAQNCCAYFPLQAGDAVLTNDPSITGASVEDFTLISHHQIQTANSPHALFKFYIVQRFHLSLAHEKETTQNVLRIPPTPVMQNHEAQAQIIDAIQVHPLSPARLSEKIRECLNGAQEMASIWSAKSQKSGIAFDKSILDNYFEQTHFAFFRFLSSQYAMGEYKFESRFDEVLKEEAQDIATRETQQLKMQVQHKDQSSFIFQFLGTGQDDVFQLTESMCLSAVLGAILSKMNMHIPLNQGVFSAIQLITPLQSALHLNKLKNSVYSTRVVLRLFTEWLQNSLQALVKEKNKHAQSAYALGPIHLSFKKPNQVWSFSIPGGQAAQPRDSKLTYHHLSQSIDTENQKHEFLASYQNWFLGLFEDPEFSIQKIEEDYPVEIISVQKNSLSENKSLLGGGAGLEFHIKLLEDAHLYFDAQVLNYFAKSYKFENADPAKICVFLDSQWMPLVNSGLLKKHTEIKFVSAAGGSWGQQQLEES